MDFLCRNFFDDTGEKLGKLERFLFFFLQMNFFVFVFFLLFEVNLEFIWFSTSCFGFNAYFMWNFPAKLKEKLDIFQKFSKKNPKIFEFCWNQEVFSFSNFKIACVIWFFVLVSMDCNSYGTGENSWHVWEVEIFRNFLFWNQKCLTFY